MGARECGGAALETRRGGPTRGRPRDDRATSTNNNAARRVAPGRDNRARAYVTATARCLPSWQPIAYVGVRPEVLRHPAWPGLFHAIRCELPGVELVIFGLALASQADYQASVAQVIGSSAGLVVITGPRAYVGPGIAREVRLAIAARLPIVVLARRGLVALADCRIESVPEPERRPWRELRIVLPPSGRPSEALRASLRAMGVSRRRP